jgi:alpha-tubulin suppressor-like RCC1 family protein
VRCWGRNFNGQVGDGSGRDRSTPGQVIDSNANPLKGVTAIAAGDQHSCAVANGTAKCWGMNASFQLGSNGPNYSLTAVPMLSNSSPLTGVTAIGAGYAHSCAIAGPTVYCTGENYSGQLGRPQGNPYTSPMALAVLTPGGTPLTGAQALTVGSYHSCALANGRAYCWGYGASGQLGSQSFSNSFSAAPVVDRNSVEVTGFTRVEANYIHTCGLINGGVQCWGDASYGQLGLGNRSLQTVPAETLGLYTSRGPPSLGYLTGCAIVNGDAWCWGYGLSYQLGNGIATNSQIPVRVAGIPHGVQGISAGQEFACAVAGGGVWCWGTNTDGQLGNNITGGQFPAPGQVLTGAGVPLTGVQSLSVGLRHACAVAGGSVWCWGNGTSGQLGNNGTFGTNFARQVQIDASGALLGNANGVAAGNDFSCALVSGQVQCWGKDDQGQLGNNFTLAAQPLPVTVQVGSVSFLSNLSNVEGIAAGQYHACAVVSGQSYCWGSNNYAQLGITYSAGFFSLVAAPALAPATVDMVTLGRFSSMSLSTGGLQNGRPIGWGYGANGQLGIGAASIQEIPYLNPSFTSGVQAVEVGYNSSCALSAGAYQCWGDNFSGQLGNNSTVSSPSPVAVLPQWP